MCGLLSWIYCPVLVKLKGPNLRFWRFGSIYVWKVLGNMEVLTKILMNIQGWLFPRFFVIYFLKSFICFLWKWIQYVFFSKGSRRCSVVFQIFTPIYFRKWSKLTHTFFNWVNSTTNWANLFSEDWAEVVETSSCWWPKSCTTCRCIKH